MTLQQKLSWTGLLIVLFPMLLSIGVMWLLIQRQNNHDAIARSHQLLGVIRNELDHQAEELLTEMLQFSQDTTLLNYLTFLIQGGENIARDLEDFYKIEIGAASARFANMNAYNMVMLFDKEHALVSYVHIEGTEHVLGIVSQATDGSVAIKTITNERVMLGKEDANPNDWVFATPSDEITLRDVTAGTDPVSTTSVFQGRLAIHTEVPIQSTPDDPSSSLLGRLAGYRYLNQDVIDRLAELTGAHINLFLESDFSVGTLPEFSNIPEPHLHELQQLPATAEMPTWNTEHTLNERSYYQLYYPFVRHEDGTIQATLALSFSKEPTYRKTREVIFLLIGVSLVCVIIIVPITLGLSGKIAGPIRKMATISESIAEGHIEQDIELVTLHDEIGSLSRSFHAMVRYLRSMASMATSISHGEIAQEIAPRSDRDTLGQAFQRMTIYMQQIASIATSIADGDLRQEFHPQSEQDILGTAFQRMTSLRQMISQVIESSEHIRAASVQLQEISELMSTDAEEASHKVELVSGTSQQITQIIRHVAAAIEEFSASIREISRNTFEVAEVANKSVKLTESASVAISDLEGQSQEIDEITKVITSITGQTHLLALNATIEAARAGESGKGFAVVADEVKTLAQEIARSAENITQKIEAIQTSSQKAVTAIREVSKMITQTDDIAHTIASALEQQTATSNEIVQNIADVSTGSDETAASIADVSTVTQHISDRADTVQESAMELASLADHLHQLVERFKI